MSIKTGGGVRRITAGIVTLAFYLHAQVGNPGSYFRIGTVANLPAACAVGSLYFATNSTAGQNLYFCTATNTWTQQLNSGGGSGAASTALTCTSTCAGTVTATSVQVFTATLSGNISATSMTTSAAVSGQLIAFQITQNGTGGYTFAWPSNVLGSCVVDPVAGVTTTLVGIWDGSNVTNPACITNDTWYGIASPTSSTTPTPVSGTTFLYTDSSTGAYRESISGATGYRIPQVIATGTTASSGSGSLNNLGAISSTACATLTISASGVVVTDVIPFTPNASLKAVVGFTPATTGGITLTAYPTSGNINIDACNWSTGSLTIGTGAALNWMVIR
jgi:hypothetical protein